MERDELTRMVIGCAVEVHRTLGPGLLEKAYQQYLAHELSLKNVPFALEVPLPVRYKTVLVDCAFPMDILVDNKLIVELKAVDEIFPVHGAQLLTYVKLAEIGCRLVLNFNELRLTDGIKRTVL